MMTATYSPEDNKLRLYAVSRLDADTYARVRAAGFIWAAKQKLFVAPTWTPEREDLLIELCGDIGDEDTSLTDRAEERAERFGGYREHRAADAESARRAVAAIADNIPLGQPILVGHHSERHARRDAEKIENGMRKAVRMWKTAEYWKHRAAGAIGHARYKQLPAVRARRIKGLESDRRRCAKNLAESQQKIRQWTDFGKLPADDAIRKIAALRILHRDYRLWAEVDAGRLSPRQAQLAALKAWARYIERNRRWIAHLDNRLTYERAMLGDQGAADLLKPKPRPALLPLCNYRAPEGIAVENKWNRGEIIRYAQVEMTQAEYAKIHSDYKGTRVVDRSHRIRTAMQRHTLVCVFLTDAKVHDRPAPIDPPEPTQPTRPRAPRRPERPDAEQAKAFEALRESLKTGVQVVSAPQLFPTPPDVASQVIELADLDAPDLTILEPSAGTGALIAALPSTAHVTAIEINGRLADALRQRFPAVTVRRADIQHIQHARRFLAPGGILVAVCANGPRQQETLKPIADAWIDLPAGTFTAAGTNVRTAILVIKDNAIRQFAEAIDAEGGQLAEAPFSLSATQNTGHQAAQLGLFGSEE